MIARAVAADVPFAWFTADEAYGQAGRLRLWLEEHDIAHVLAVPKSQMVVSMDLLRRRAHSVIAELDESGWQRLSCGDGAHGQRISDWAVVDIRPLRRPGVGHWLLARRSVADPAKIETGLDHYQVRRYEAWYRHVTLSMAAAAFLTITRDAAKKGALHPAARQP
jgi:SRSO17 transposase